ncbi:MAG TPA: hypothetical protein VF286_10915 [Acidiphilium sp.]
MPTSIEYRLIAETAHRTAVRDAVFGVKQALQAIAMKCETDALADCIEALFAGLDVGLPDYAAIEAEIERRWASEAADAAIERRLDQNGGL